MRTLLIFIVFLVGLQTLGQDVESLSPITPENTAELQQIGILGRGVANDLDWHPEGDKLAVASATGVWILNESLDEASSTPITKTTTRVAWSPDGSYIALIVENVSSCSVQIWDDHFTEEIIRLDECADGVSWHPSSTYLLILPRYKYYLLESNEVHTVELSTGNIAALPGQFAVWSPTGDVLFTQLKATLDSSDSTPTLYAWYTKTRELLSSVDISEMNFRSILWGLDSKTVVLECVNQQENSDRIDVGLCSFDIVTENLKRLLDFASFSLGQSGSYSNLSWNSEQDYLAYVHENFSQGFLSLITVFDFNTHEGKYVGAGSRFDWKPNSDEMTAIVGNGEIRTYDALTGTEIASSPWFNAAINMIALRPDSTQIASAGFGYLQNTNIWDYSLTWRDPFLSFYVEPAEIVDYTSDGSELIAGGTITTDIVANQYIAVFDADTGDLVRNLAGFYDQGRLAPVKYWNADYTEEVFLPEAIIASQSSFEFARAYWSPDYSRVAVIRKWPTDVDCVVEAWDIKEARRINYFEGGMYSCVDATWSSDSSQIAVTLRRMTGSGAFDLLVRTFSVLDGKDYIMDNHDYQVFAELDSFVTPQPIVVAWNTDSTLLAIGLQNELQIHDLENRQMLISLPVNQISDIEWAENDEFVATGSLDGTIRLWGVSDKNQ